MQINTSSEKIHKLTSLKFEVLNVAEKTINAIPSQYFILNVSGSFYLYMSPLYIYLYVTTIYAFVSQRVLVACLSRALRAI